MIVIKNKFIPFGTYTTMNLFGIIITKVELNDEIINHERIHSVQMLEVASVVACIIGVLVTVADVSAWWLLMSCPTYYIWYVIEYMWISVMHDKQVCAYRDISFEEEAHANDNNLNYLKNRTPFAWIKYLACESNHNNDRNCCN